MKVFIGSVKFRRALSLALVLCLCCPLMGYGMAEEEQPAYILAAENESLKLYVGETEPLFYVEDGAGNIWYSSPLDAKKDKMAAGKTKKYTASMIKITAAKRLLDGSLTPVNSESLTVPDQLGLCPTCGQPLPPGPEKYQLSSIENGAEMTMDFRKQGVKIKVRLELQGDSLVITLPKDGVEEKEGSFLVSVEVAPHLGASQISDQGYIVTPCGSGSVIEFGFESSAYNSFTAPIWGGNRIVYGNRVPNLENQLLFPMYGIVKNGAMITAIIESGAAESQITARKPGAINGYYAAFATWLYRQSDFVQMVDGEMPYSKISDVPAAEDFSIRYIFTPENGSYNQMAKVYRSYLESHDGFPKETKGTELFVSSNASVFKTSYFLGIPYTSSIPVTTASEMQEMLGKIREMTDGPIKVLYEGVLKEGYRGSVSPEIRLSGTAGSAAQWQALHEMAAANNAEIIPVVDPIYVYQSGSGVRKHYDTATDMSKLTTEHLPQNIVKKDKTLPEGGHGLLKHELLFKHLNAFGKEQAQGVDGLCLENLLIQYYTDYRNPGFFMQDFIRKTEEAMQQLKAANYSLYAKGTNSYALPYVDGLVEMPASGTGAAVFTYSIPFIYMVMNGKVDYALAPYNRSSDRNQALLKMIETGAVPHFTLNQTETEELMDSMLEDQGCESYDYWLDETKAVLDASKAVREKTEGTALCGYERLSPEASLVTYENGQQILINFGTEAYTYNGIQVDGSSYSFLKE